MHAFNYSYHLSDVSSCHCGKTSSGVSASIDCLISKRRLIWNAGWRPATPLSCEMDVYVLTTVWAAQVRESWPCWSHTTRALWRVEEQLDFELNCSICMETYINPKLLQCFHVFCLKCLVALQFEGCLRMRK